jgi:CopG family nickel-responsive transcriptional regulator
VICRDAPPTCAFADAVIAERGVRHGGLNLVPVDVGAAAHRHVHVRPKS